MLFVLCSSESLDRVGRRESYLKSNFESLGGQNDNLDMTVVSGETDDGSPLNKSNLSSLTSKFLTKSNSNADMISAVKANQRDPEAARKREELQRRIEETRRKLQSVRVTNPIFLNKKNSFQVLIFFLFPSDWTPQLH